MSIGQYSKSLAVLLVGAQAWGVMVVKSPSAAITSGEWMVLVGYLVAFVLAFLVPNAPASVPAPPKTPAPGTSMTVVGGSYEPVPSKAAQP